MSAIASEFGRPLSLWGRGLTVVPRWLGRLVRPREQAEEVDVQRLPLNQLLASGRWIRKTPDPELRKILGVVQSEVGESRRLLAHPDATGALRTRAVLRELGSLLQQRVDKLTVDTAWELAGSLKRANLRLGDEQYIGGLLEYEACRRKDGTRWHAWEAHFAKQELNGLLKAYRSGSPTANQRAQAVDRLTFLYLRRSEAGRDRRTRAAIKSSYLTQLALILFALLVGLGAAAAPPERDVLWRSLLLAACAGALGSTLSGIFKVRDQLIRLDELRSFAPAMRVQPLVGACAGIILLLVLNSKAVSLGTAEGEAWSRLGLLAFAVGFSEPFFLGLVQRIAVVPTRESAGASRTTPGQR